MVYRYNDLKILLGQLFFVLRGTKFKSLETEMDLLPNMLKSRWKKWHWNIFYDLLYFVYLIKLYELVWMYRPSISIFVHAFGETDGIFNSVAEVTMIYQLIPREINNFLIRDAALDTYFNHNKRTAFD